MTYKFNPLSGKLDIVVDDHTKLSNIGSNTHALIDTHIGSTSNPHSVTLTQVGGTTDHTALSNIGTNTHSVIDTHIAGTGTSVHGLGTMSTATETNYALLAGRAGGQTLIGGTASGDDLTLQSTSHETKGSIIFGTSAYDEVNNRLGIRIAVPIHPLQVYADVGDTKNARAAHIEYRTQYDGTEGSGFSNVGLYAVGYVNPANAVVNVQEYYAMYGFIRNDSTLVTDSCSLYGLRFSPQNFASSGTLGGLIGIDVYPYQGGEGTTTNAYAIYTRPWMAKGTITNWYGFYMNNDNKGTGTIVNEYGIYIKTVDGGSTLNYAIYSEGGENYFGGEAHIDGALNHDGTTVGFYGATPATQAAHIADPTDLATCISAITSINAMLAATGLTAAS